MLKKDVRKIVRIHPGESRVLDRANLLYAGEKAVQRQLVLDAVR